MRSCRRANNHDARTTGRGRGGGRLGGDGFVHMLPLSLISSRYFGRQWFHPRRDDSSDDGIVLWGMRLFVVSLAVLFAASLVLYFVSRSGWAAISGPVPYVPRSVYAATAVLMVSSLTIRAAVAATRSGRARAQVVWLSISLVLGCAFLVLQFATWVLLTARQIDATTNLAAFSLYLLTVLHALHVAGGVLGLTWVTLRARRGAYTPQRSAGLRACALYWHFLDGVWVVIFLVLFVVR